MMGFTIRRLGALSLMIATSVATACFAPAAYAQQGASPEKLKLAAEEFDAGRRSFKLEQYESAARHFETAFRDAPAAPALRLAIVAWEKAGALARAATLAVRAQGLYPDDQRTIKLTQQVLERVSGKLGKVAVSCDPACTLSLDGHLVDEREVSEGVFFADPGEHMLQTGWSHGRVKSKKLVAKEGEALRFSFDAPPIPKKKEPSAANGEQHAGAVGVDTGRSGKASPLLFWLGTGVVGVVGGVTIWSGIDTLNNPGPDKVKEECIGQGDQCPAYQDGLSRQRRTNYLLVGTAVGAASVAVIGVFFTDWGGKEKTGHARTTVTPIVGAKGTLGLTAQGHF